MLSNLSGTAYQAARFMPDCPLHQALVGAIPLPHLTGAGVIVAVSGGADSLALAHATIRHCRESRSSGPAAPPVCLVHVNHGLRGSESRADQELVSRLAEKWDVPCEAVAGPLPEDLRGRPREQTLRKIRYGLIGDVARRRGVRTVLTAHHADDAAETLLFRIARGTGIAGLRSIPAVRELEPGISLVRPFLMLTRQQLRDYAEAHELPFREDASNEDRGPARNWIRHEIMPRLIERFGPAVVTRLNELASEAGQWHDALAELTGTLRQAAVVNKTAGRIDFSAAAGMDRYRPLVIRQMLAGLWREMGWPEREMTRHHWQELVTLLRQPSPEHRRQLTLPGHVLATRHPDGSARLETRAGRAGNH